MGVVLQQCRRSYNPKEGAFESITYVLTGNMRYRSRANGIDVAYLLILIDVQGFQDSSPDLHFRRKNGYKSGSRSTL
jgi:hypothetical protein